MICEKCHNEYSSTYYFATPTICKYCFEKLPQEEQEKLRDVAEAYTGEQTITLRATFGKRFLAALVDTLIIIIIVLAFFKINGFLDAQIEFYQEISKLATDPQGMKEYQNEFFQANRLNFAFPALVYLFYFLSEALSGVSFGKYLVGLKIASLNGNPATSAQLWIRYLVKNSASIMSLFWAATLLSYFNLLNTIFGLAIFFGFLLILGRNRQNLQDIVARTTVFKTEILEKLSEVNNFEQTNIGQ